MYSSAVTPHIMSADDVPQLLAAVEVALRRHLPKEQRCHHVCPDHSLSLREVTQDRRAIQECPECELVVHTICMGCDTVCPCDNAWPCAEVRGMALALGAEVG